MISLVPHQAKIENILLLNALRKQKYMGKKDPERKFGVAVFQHSKNGNEMH